MIGNRVSVVRTAGGRVEGELRHLDPAGATVYRNDGTSDGQGNLFVPMHTIVEIIDRGRVPGW